MKIAGTEYNLNHKALEIYFSGCKAPHCEGCHNSELWDFNFGYDPFGKIFISIVEKAKDPMVEKIWLLGGEPLDQNREEFLRFIYMLWFWTDAELWLWTRYTDIPKEVYETISFVKTGAYDKTLDSYVDERHGITLASSNQKIIKLDITD